MTTLTAEQLTTISTSNDPIKVGSYVYNKLTAFSNSDVYAYTRSASGNYRAWTANSTTLSSAKNTNNNNYSQMFLVAKKAGYLNLTYTVTGNAVEVLYYKNGGVCTSASYPSANNGSVDHGKNDFTGGNSNKAFPRIYVPQGQIIGFYFYSAKAYTGTANNGQAVLTNLSIKTLESLEEDYINGDINRNTIIFNNVTDPQDPTAGGHISLTGGGESVDSVTVYDGYPVTVYSVVDTDNGYKDVWISKSSTYDYANYIDCDDFKNFPTRYTLTYSGTGNNTLYYDVRFFDTDYVELYTDPDTGLKVETSGYYWRYGQLSGDDVLLSGARKKTGEGTYSFLKITAPADQSGVLSFDYKLDFNANDPISGTAGYNDGKGGIFLYRMGAEPANFEWREDNFNAGSGVRKNSHIEGDFDNEFNDDEDHNYCYWQTRDELIYHDPSLHKYIGTVDWTNKSFTLFANQTIYLAKYSLSLSSTNDVMYLRNVSFEQRDVSSITFDQPTGGFMSTADSLDSTKAAQSSYIGFVGTVPDGLSTVYAIPDIENGYVFEGLYTSPDYSAESLVEPDAGTTRAYSLVYPESDTTYYPKFVRKDAIRLTVSRSNEYITNIRYRKIAVLRDRNNISISYNGAQRTWSASANNYIDLYPGDVYSFSYAVNDSCITNGIYLTYKNAQGETVYDDLLSKASAVSSVIFDYDTLAAAGAVDPVVEIRAAYSPYAPVAGYTAPAGANVEVSTRSVEGAFVEQRKSSSTVNGEFYNYDSLNYLWYYDSATREFIAGNCGIDASYAFLKVKALTAGTLYLDCRISSAGNDYMYISYNGKDPTLSSGNWTTVFDGPTPGIMQTKYIEDPTSLTGLSPDTSWRTITKTVSAGETIRFAFNKDDSSSAHEDCAFIKNVRVLTTPQSATFETSDFGMGRVSLDNETFTDSVSSSNLAIEGTVTAYAKANDGFRFVGWYDSFFQTTVSSEAEFTYTVNEPNPTFTAVFAPDFSGDPVATINGIAFGSLKTAMIYAKPGNVVILEKDFTQDEDLTIPAAVTLLIPFDKNNTLYTETPKEALNANGNTSANCYRCLTIAPNTIVTVDGAISLSAKHPTSGTGDNKYGAVSGPYSQLELEDGSEVVLCENSKLYAWGFITGKGKITAKSGSTVYEIMQVNDFRGGSITSSMYFEGYNQFPFNQYYVQNIETQVRYEYGAKESVLIDIYASNKSNKATVEFIGSNGMFRIDDEDSYIERWYDAENDKMHYNICGNARMGEITLRVLSISMSSGKYYLPINNIDVSVKLNSQNKSSFEVSGLVIFLPGSSITVDRDASLTITDGSLVLADKNLTSYSASNSKPCSAALFSPSRVKARTWDTTDPACLNNNGTVTVNDGAALSTTGDGAVICSKSECGVFEISGDNIPVKIDCIATSGTNILEEGTEENSIDIDKLSSTLTDDTDGCDFTERWFDGDASQFTMRTIDGKTVWGDYRNITFKNVDGADLGTKTDLNVSDRNSVHDFDEEVNYAGFDEDNKYWKYVGNGTWTYERKYPNNPNNTDMIATPVGEKESIFEQHSLSLNGDIGVNFYLFDAPAGAQLRYSWGGDDGTDLTAVSDILANRSTPQKKSSVNIAAKEMNDGITVEMILNGDVIATETYKASTYLTRVITEDDLAAELVGDEKADELIALCKSMLTYGRYAQLQFNYHTDDLCPTYESDASAYNEITSDDLSAYSAENAAYSVIYTDMEAFGMSFYGVALSLNSRTDFNIFYRNNAYVPATVTAVDSTNTLFDVSRTVVGSNEDPNSGDFIRYDILDIPAAKLTADFTVTFTPDEGSAVSYTVNPATYMYSALVLAEAYGDGYDSTRYLAKVISTLYNYNQKAVAFFA